MPQLARTPFTFSHFTTLIRATIGSLTSPYHKFTPQLAHNHVFVIHTRHHWQSHHIIYFEMAYAMSYLNTTVSGGHYWLPDIHFIIGHYWLPDIHFIRCSTTGFPISISYGLRHHYTSQRPTPLGFIHSLPPLACHRFTEHVTTFDISSL